MVMSRIALCMNVRDEGRDIAEWIAFHGAVGFHSQIIFDNRSTDSTPEIIKAASKVLDVRYHHWDRTDSRYQVDAYFTACHVYRHEFDWIAFVDSDEYLMPEFPVHIAEYLDGFKDRDVGGIGVNWATYGSSGLIDFPSGLIAESFIRRSSADFFPNRHIKSIVRPLSVISCDNPHWFNTDAPYVDAAGNPLEWYVSDQGEVVKGLTKAIPDYKGARINHYFTRSLAHWKRKVNRGYPADIAIRKMEEFEYYNRNEIEDPIAVRYMPNVLKILDRIGNP
ncbi:putative cytosolic protein [Granulibacter bethesdensis]|uniref:Cytosolic protein n=2 Tax=Granulibacter bethesdensis TaxID=364410 RepID=A0AAN0RBH7_9PROT|nr:putative cytosolic protein [Granulibacter bethesdensis]